jgi:biotin carboxylase
VRRTRDKLSFRRLLVERGFLCPRFRHLPSGRDPRELGDLRFPCVVKARRLSASRGVIRANNPEELLRAVNWVRAIQASADRDAEDLGIVIEDFIPGAEYALEGALQSGELVTLALFDKPDPLDGPYFEETIYVTPSRLPTPVQRRIHDVVARACRLAGLISGPVHAEMRVNEEGIWILEIAARSIGGLCARVLTHSLGTSLEELILRQALGEPLGEVRDSIASGVMMIPIPRRGIYHGVDGLDAALAVPGITGITITAQKGQVIAPPPEGASYLGFMFARTDNPFAAEGALRNALRRLHFQIRPEYPAVRTSAAARL